MRAVMELVNSQIEEHQLSEEWLRGDDTKAPILAKGKADTGRACLYVRDDRLVRGHRTVDSPILRSGGHSGDQPEWHLKRFGGILQADASTGYNGLYLRAAPRMELILRGPLLYAGLEDLHPCVRRSHRGKPEGVCAFETPPIGDFH